MKKILFLFLFMLSTTIFASAFRVGELKIGHTYYVYFKASIYYKAFIDKGQLISKRHGVLLFKRKGDIVDMANLSDVKAEAFLKFKQN